ncbi:hypothetical protein [Streptomyces globosus]|uniref:hypothetical protein n=1 Tax=Streptomyces globosus TaxID=68209 RepID=UPI00362B4590
MGRVRRCHLLARRADHVRQRLHPGDDVRRDRPLALTRAAPGPSPEPSRPRPTWWTIGGGERRVAAFKAPTRRSAAAAGPLRGVPRGRRNHRREGLPCTGGTRSCAGGCRSGSTIRRSAGSPTRATWASGRCGSAYREAYEAVLGRCSTAVAPWYVVPADRKWYRARVAARCCRSTWRRWIRAVRRRTTTSASASASGSAVRGG